MQVEELLSSSALEERIKDSILKHSQGLHNYQRREDLDENNERIYSPTRGSPSRLKMSSSSVPNKWGSGPFTPEFYSRKEASSSPAYDELNNTEEESLKLLKGQLQQLQSIRVDNEQKDQLISRLKFQVGELTSFKEQSNTMKLKIAALENLAQQRDIELNNKNDEISLKEKCYSDTETLLRQRLKDLEESLIEQREFDERRYTSRLNEMERALNVYKSTEMEKEEERRHLEYELTIAARSAQMAELDAKEKESQMAAQLLVAQNQLKILTDEKENHLNRSDIVEKELRRLREIANYQDSDRQKLEDALHEAKSLIAGLQTALRSANTEAALVPQYQRELAMIPTLKVAARELMEEKEKIMDKVRELENIVLTAGEERKRLTQQFDHLQGKLAYASEETNRVRRMSENTISTAENFEKCKENLIIATNALKREKEDSSREYNNLTCELESLFDLSMSCLSPLPIASPSKEGNQPSSAFVLVEKWSPKEEGAPGREFLSNLSSNMIKISNILKETREKAKKMNMQLNETQNTLSNKEHDLSVLSDNYEHAKASLENTNKECITLRTQNNNLQLKVNEYVQEKAKLESVLSERNSLATASCNQLRDVYNILYDCNADHHEKEDEVEEGLMQHTEFIMKFSQVKSKVIERSSYINRLVKEKKEAEEISRNYLTKIEEVKNNSVQAEGVMRNSHSATIASLKEEKIKLQEKLKMTEDALHESMDVGDSAVKEARRIESNLFSCRETVEKLQKILSILCRGVLPLHRRFTDILSQRKLLVRQAKSNDRIIKDLQQLHEALDVEDQTDDELKRGQSIDRKRRSRKKMTLRSVVIVILASLRIFNLYQIRECKYGKSSKTRQKWMNSSLTSNEDADKHCFDSLIKYNLDSSLDGDAFNHFVNIAISSYNLEDPNRNLSGSNNFDGNILQRLAYGFRKNQEIIGKTMHNPEEYISMIRRSTLMLVKQLSVSENQILTLSNKLVEHGSINASADEALMQANELCSFFESQMKDLNQELETQRELTEADITRAHRETNDLRSLLEAQQSLVDDLKNELNESSNVNLLIENQSSALRSQVSSLGDEITQLKKVLNKKEIQNESCIRVENELRMHIKKIEEEMHRANDKLVSCEAEAISLAKSLQEVKSSYKNAKATNKKYEESIIHYEKEMVVMEKLKIDLAKAQSEADSYCEINEAAKIEIELQRKRLYELEFEIASSEAIAKERAILLNEHLMAEEDLENALQSDSLRSLTNNNKDENEGSSINLLDTSIASSNLMFKTNVERSVGLRDYMKRIDNKLGKKHNALKSKNLESSF